MTSRDHNTLRAQYLDNVSWTCLCYLAAIANGL